MQTAGFEKRQTCTLHANCSFRKTETCTLHENCRFQKMSNLHFSCKLQFSKTTKTCTLHANCRFQKQLSLHFACKLQFSKKQKLHFTSNLQISKIVSSTLACNAQVSETQLQCFQQHYRYSQQHPTNLSQPFCTNTSSKQKVKRNHVEMCSSSQHTSVVFVNLLICVFVCWGYIIFICKRFCVLLNV